MTTNRSNDLSSPRPARVSSDDGRVAVSAGWVSVAVAASYLGLSPDRLRKTLERYAQRVDGSITSTVDGVTARKFGRLWRVRFSTSWTEGESP